jgi:hypothetical protein
VTVLATGAGWALAQLHVVDAVTGGAGGYFGVHPARELGVDVVMAVDALGALNAIERMREAFEARVAIRALQPLVDRVLDPLRQHAHSFGTNRIAGTLVQELGFCVKSRALQRMLRRSAV